MLHQPPAKESGSGNWMAMEGWNSDKESWKPTKIDLVERKIEIL